MLAHPSEISLERFDQFTRPTFDSRAGLLRFRIKENVIELRELWRWRRTIEGTAHHRHNAFAEPDCLLDFPLANL
jgi:hypothetical protein